MRSPHSFDNSCRTAAGPCVRAAGPPHLPLQVACLGVVEVPLPAAGLYLVGAPADGVSACRQTQLCPRSTSCRPSAPAAAGCLIVVVEVPQPAAGLYRFLQMICKFEVRWLLPARSRLCPVRSCPASECCATPVSFETGLLFL